MTKSATITKAPEWDVLAKVERVRWRIETSTGRTKYVRTRREAREWCEEFGYSVTPGGSKNHAAGLMFVDDRAGDRHD